MTPEKSIKAKDSTSSFEWADFIRRVVLIIAGGFIGAAGVNLFLVPFHLITAGVAGLALLITYIAPAIPVGVLIALFNVPIMILGWILIDRKFIQWSIFGMAAFAFFLDLTHPWSNIRPVNDLYMALIAGGLLSGLGVGMTFRARGSMGGTDILAAILRKYYSTSIGTGQMGLNGIILAVLAFRFTLQSAMASAFSIFFEAWASDKTIMGLNKAKALMVVTEKSQAVGDALMEKLDRGVTYFHGRGGFNMGEKEIVYCIMPGRQLSQAKSIVEHVDPAAFSSVLDAIEVMGLGFKRMPI